MDCRAVSCGDSSDLGLEGLKEHMLLTTPGCGAAVWGLGFRVEGLGFRA